MLVNGYMAREKETVQRLVLVTPILDSGWQTKGTDMDVWHTTLDTFIPDIFKIIDIMDRGRWNTL